MSTLFGKYEIKKVHGETDPNAQYFVLRIDTDPAARAALLVYADQIKDVDPEFAKELQAWVFVYTGSNLTKRAPDLPKAERIGKVYPGTWEEVDKSNEESASG